MADRSIYSGLQALTSAQRWQFTIAAVQVSGYAAALEAACAPGSGIDIVEQLRHVENVNRNVYQQFLKNAPVLKEVCDIDC